MRKRWLRKKDSGYEAFVEELRQIVSDGYTMKQVAEMFGTAKKAVTKGAVAGCTHRNGITFCSKDSEKGGSTKKPAHSNSRETEKKQVSFDSLFQPIETKRCNWPIGDPKERGFRLCGNTDLVKGLKFEVYCREHFDMAYQEKKKPALPFQF